MILRQLFQQPLNSYISLASSVVFRNHMKNQKINLITKRTFVGSFQPKVSPEQFRLQDKIPIGYNLIYRATMTSYVKIAQYVSVTSLTTIGFLCLHKYYNVSLYEVSDLIGSSSKLIHEDQEMLYFLVGLLLLNIAVFLFIRKLPIRIYFNETSKEYIGVKLGWLPIMKYFIHFKPGELIQKSEGVLPWTQYEYKMKNGANIILLEQYFRKPQDMNIMLGHVIKE